MAGTASREASGLGAATRSSAAALSPGFGQSGKSRSRMHGIASTVLAISVGAIDTKAKQGSTLTNIENGPSAVSRRKAFKPHNPSPKKRLQGRGPNGHIPCFPKLCMAFCQLCRGSLGILGMQRDAMGRFAVRTGRGWTEVVAKPGPSEAEPPSLAGGESRDVGRRLIWRSLNPKATRAAPGLTRLRLP
ncbi:predicted protein [Histoplasma capsulatum G186AR]|uniref:Uncharacterized protein n=1 Tax=Ajellomyces capsulatus (strain G186AR / H82 / ATCC MYA-2454 / RMSCC 2432) TaxID=447093 RepID=C0NM80_AJECG|nr:uncharacterized protein HCBG_04610 [Histoplasma capsulatum G186AR]EEH07731.1 predicted protein [Histoplasma capsulatum G186AR]